MSVKRSSSPAFRSHRASEVFAPQPNPERLQDPPSAHAVPRLHLHATRPSEGMDWPISGEEKDSAQVRLVAGYVFSISREKTRKP